MYIKRWTTKQKHTIEATINLRDCMVGIGFDYDMYYVKLGPFELCYIPFVVPGWHGVQEK